MAFQCVIVTPERQVLDAALTQAIIPAHDGLMGIQTDRAPLLVKLGIGPLRVDLTNGPKRYFAVAGGVAQMKDNKLTIVTDEAMAAEEIDAEAARAEYAEAAARRTTDPRAADERVREMRKAQVKQKLAR